MKVFDELLGIGWRDADCKSEERKLQGSDLLSFDRMNQVYSRLNSTLESNVCSLRVAGGPCNDNLAPFSREFR